MQFHLMENGIDSLKFGMLHYKRFLENSNDISLEINEYFSDLKFATIAFHNAIELFTKQVLYDVNELLIFNVDVTDEIVSGLLYQKYIENNKDSHLDFWLVGKVDTTYKTIEYNRSIEILKSIFKQDFTKENYQTLDSLVKKETA